MKDLNPAEASLIKGIYRTDVFQALRSLAGQMIVNWSKQGRATGTEWEFVRDCLVQEGKIQSLESFFKQIEQIALEPRNK